MNNRSQHKNNQDSTHPLHLRPEGNNMARVGTMAMSGLFMMLVFGGIGMLLLEVLDVGLKNIHWQWLLIQSVLLGFTLLLGLVVARAGTQVGNVMIGVVFDAYKLGVVLAEMWLYFEIISRMFYQVYDLWKYFAYLLILLIGMTLLLILNRFSESLKLIMHAVGIFAIALVHLLVIFGQYILNRNMELDFFAADFIMMLIMIFGGVFMIISGNVAQPRKSGPRQVWRGNQSPPQQH